MSHLDEPISWDQMPLFDPDERYRVVVGFNGFTGWEWGLHHRWEGEWHVLDSGMQSTIQGATHAAQQALGSIYG